MEGEPLFDLLNDPVIWVQESNAPPVPQTLPEVFHKLSNGRHIEFSDLQAHQSHAWHAFLCQLGAIALHSAGESAVTAKSVLEWTELLLRTAAGQREPWCLVVPDLSKPAFLQPPVPEGSLDKWKNEAREPDLLDLLVTSKNHDVKRRRISAPRTDHWAFALISVQTTDGFAGRNNYGIMRMNGGYGSRAGLAVCASDQPAVRFRRDCSLLLERRDELAHQFGFAARMGVALLWLTPWDGGKSITLRECDPLVIEICRRVRLTANGDEVVARLIGTATPRIDEGETKGNVGDAWIPVRRKDAAGLTAKNLSYTLLQDVIFGSDYEPSAASIVRNEDGESPVIVGHLLVRGQGKTEGYFERLIPCPPKARSMLASLDGRRSLGSLARERVDVVTTVRNKILKPAILNLLQGGPDKIKFDDDRVKPFSDSFERMVDDAFFPSLFDSVDRDPNTARQNWVAQLLEFARTILDDAIGGTPIPTARRYRAISAAEGVFHGSSRKNFPDNFRSRTGGTTNAELRIEH